MATCPGCGRPRADDCEESATLGERVAEIVAEVGSSWSFVALMTAIMLGWGFLNVSGLTQFDPYPFILMNLGISVVTTFQGPVIMMSQNRIAARDRRRAEENYQVNVRTEALLLALHAKIDRVGPDTPPEA